MYFPVTSTESIQLSTELFKPKTGSIWIERFRSRKVVQSRLISHSSGRVTFTLHAVSMGLCLYSYMCIQCTSTVFARSDATATIYFSKKFCAASIRERHSFNSAKTLCKYTRTKSTGVSTDGTEDNEIHCLKEGGVTDDARETAKRDTGHSYLSVTCRSARSGRYVHV